MTAAPLGCWRGSVNLSKIFFVVVKCEFPFNQLVPSLLVVSAAAAAAASAKPPSVLRGAFLPTKTAMHSLHNKLFRNYKDWCESMRIAPCFMPYPPGNDDVYGGRGGSEKMEVRTLFSFVFFFSSSASNQQCGRDTQAPF